MARKNAPNAEQLPEKDHEPHMCRAQYSGMRCRYFWVISESTHGGAGFCNRHAELDKVPFDQRKTMPGWAMEYARIVQDSNNQREAA